MALPKEVAERLRYVTQQKRGVLLKDINWRDVPYYMDEIILTCPEASKPIPQEWPDRVPSRLCFLRGVNWSLQEVLSWYLPSLFVWQTTSISATGVRLGQDRLLFNRTALKAFMKLVGISSPEKYLLPLHFAPEMLLATGMREPFARVGVGADGTVLSIGLYGQVCQEVRDVLYHTLSPWNQDTLRFYRWRQGTHSFFVVGQRKFPDGTSRFTCSAWRQSSGLIPMPGHTWRQGDTGFPFSVIARELQNCPDALATKPVLDKWFLRYSE